MSATITKLAGPFRRGGGPGGTGYMISVALDASHAAGGEELDITSYLGYFYGAEYQGSDAAADETLKYTINGPGVTTATTSSNVLLQAVHSKGADAEMEPADTEDLSAHGALIFTIWGTNAIVSSWA